MVFLSKKIFDCCLFSLIQLWYKFPREPSPLQESRPLYILPKEAVRIHVSAEFFQPTDKEKDAPHKSALLPEVSPEEYSGFPVPHLS